MFGKQTQTQANEQEASYPVPAQPSQGRMQTQVDRPTRDTTGVKWFFIVVGVLLLAFLFYQAWLAMLRWFLTLAPFWHWSILILLGAIALTLTVVFVIFAALQVGALFSRLLNTIHTHLFPTQELATGDVIQRRIHGAWQNIYEPKPVRTEKEHTGKPQEVYTLAQEPHLLAFLHDMQQEGAQGRMLFGIDMDGLPVWKTWAADLFSHFIVGKSRSGKTYRMAFLVIAGLFLGFDVWLGDYHATKTSGLLKMLTPLHARLTRIARTQAEMLTLIADFQIEMGRRKDGLISSSRPILIVLDEIAHFIDDLHDIRVAKGETPPAQKVAAFLRNCVEAYSGYQGYCLIGTHEVTSTSFGDGRRAGTRRNIQSLSLMKADEETAKMLGFKKKADLERIMGMKRGYGLTRTMEEDTYTKLYTPFFGVPDAVTGILPGIARVAELLAYSSEHTVVDRHGAATVSLDDDNFELVDFADDEEACLPLQTQPRSYGYRGTAQPLHHEEKYITHALRAAREITAYQGSATKSNIVDFHAHEEATTDVQATTGSDVHRPVEPLEVNNSRALTYQFDSEQIGAFIHIYKKLGSTEKALREMGIGQGYYSCASQLVKERGLKKAANS